MTLFHKDLLFAPLDADLRLARIGGGNETEVYCTDDHHYVVKVKPDEAGPPAYALAQAFVMREAAQRFSAAIGHHHSIPNHFLVTVNADGLAQAIVVQPYYRNARPLFALDYGQLNPAQRARIVWQLLHLIGQAVTSYLHHGWMPDLYGRASASKAERKQLNAWRQLPARLWSFLIWRNLLRSHNLMLTPDDQIILVDYDAVRHGKLYQFFYYQARLALFVRDLIVILMMWLSGYAPQA